LLTTTDALGAVTRTTYDPKGNAIFETDAMGRTSTSTYDLAGNVLTTADPLGNTTRFSYDLRGRMSTRTDAEGVTTSYTHDALGNQLSEVVYRTDEFGAQVKVERTQKYDVLNRVVMDTDALGHTAVTEYDPIGRVTARVDRRGFRSVTEYDELGQLSAMRYADGTHERYTYDAEGRRLETTDRGGRVTSAEYDELGRRVRTTNADLTTRSTVYDVAGNVRAEIDERGNRTEYEYDAQNRRVLTRSAVGDESLVSFDAVGNRETVTDGRGNVTTFEHDLNRRQIATLFADGYSTRTVYDFGGRVTSYGYDELGNRVSQTDANLHTTTFGFDSEGRMASRTLPLGQRESLEYDAEGNQTAKVTFNGDRLEYDFDSNGRMIRKRVPGYSEYVITYTATGQRESVLDYRGLTSYEYDSRDRLLRVDNPEGTFVSYTYDLAGNRASVTSPSQTVEYAFDALNRMETVTSPGGLARYAYDAASNQVGLTHANGVHEVRTYDALNRLLSIENRTSGGHLVTSHAYTLGPTGTRVAVQEHNSRFVTWSYDDLYRLVGEDIVDPVNGDESIALVYDPVGNRLSRTVGSGVTEYGYDDNDRLLDVEGVARTYDDNGNTLTAGATTYSWSPENRLIAADTGSQVLAFEYNLDGIRVSKDVDGLATEYVLDANRRYAEVLEERGTSGLQASYVHGQDLMSQERDGTESFYHSDGIGSTRALTNELQSVSDSYAYEAFGKAYGAFGSTTNSYGFTGEQVDEETGLEYLRARYYEPDTGTLLSLDPIADVLSARLNEVRGRVRTRLQLAPCRGDRREDTCCRAGHAALPSIPVAQSLYGYATSDPVNSSDPSGAIVVGPAAFSFSLPILESLSRVYGAPRTPLPIEALTPQEDCDEICDEIASELFDECRKDGYAVWLCGLLMATTYTVCMAFCLKLPF
ncbi:MAG: RHS repeat protein, partial [Deltaproteobacteria bacterium]|nr:RHS repeat protein [Deltaproteobacteria bacterium]